MGALPGSPASASAERGRDLGAASRHAGRRRRARVSRLLLAPAAAAVVVAAAALPAFCGSATGQQRQPDVSVSVQGRTWRSYLDTTTEDWRDPLFDGEIRRAGMKYRRSTMNHFGRKDIKGFDIEPGHGRREPIIHRRRGMMYQLMANRSWIQLDTEYEMPVPSDESRWELKRQLTVVFSSQKGRGVPRTLEFLDGALRSPAFDFDHMIMAVRGLGNQVVHMKRQQQEELRTKWTGVVQDLASLGGAMLEAKAEQWEEEGLHEEYMANPDRNPEGFVLTYNTKWTRPDSVVMIFESLAKVQDQMPELTTMVPAASRAVTAVLDDVDAVRVAPLIDSIVKLREKYPELRDTLLPKIVRHPRWAGWTQYLWEKNMPKWKQYQKALTTLKKEVPYLRLVLESSHGK